MKLRNFAGIIFMFLGSALLICESVAEDHEVQPLSLDLSAAIVRALQANPEIMARRQALGVAQSRVQQAELLFQENPRLSVDLDSRNRSFTHPSGRSGVDVEVRLLQELEIAGQRGYRREASTKQLAQAEVSVADAERLLRLEAARDFYDLLALQEKISVRQEVLAMHEALLQAGLTRFDRGDISVLELDTLRLDRDRTRSDLISQEEERSGKEQQFHLLLGLGEHPALRLVGNITTRSPDPEHSAQPLVREDLEVCALEHRPDIKAARLAVAGREAELRLAQARRIPNVSVGPLYKLDNEDQVLGGALSIPLPFFNRNQHEITAAIANLQVDRTELEARMLVVKHEVAATFTRLQLAARQLASYGTTYPGNLTESMTYARRAYEAGELSIFEFSTTLERLVQARLRYLDTLLAYHHAALELDAQSAFQCVDTMKAELQEPQK
jgi:cobalt-zinc-cadmium efflux system outer membrane protein